ncbi:uncharacterized protein MONBRDRAFT_11105 [Monosiga brevicollis MX1]|uniref:N-acetylgalactosaminide beta-1,3-galactosyltransferase n=1 Tax=Monosiga brevicollis TaxID=81824 RepID=A9V882_MONBE|nr:uncharacterized protein MONBRDRAFT_11105 [Monosiga brevicollis MX1]EDQ86224.1 predicted protein [Monosiga brevicollis MX1]|eukprot:XP_001748894.1 hypothetical protein [Monosiga brevicollis MX1]
MPSVRSAVLVALLGVALLLSGAWLLMQRQNIPVLTDLSADRVVLDHGLSLDHPSVPEPSTTTSANGLEEGDDGDDDRPYNGDPISELTVPPGRLRLATSLLCLDTYEAGRLKLWYCYNEQPSTQGNQFCRQLLDRHAFGVDWTFPGPRLETNDTSHSDLSATSLLTPLPKQARLARDFRQGTQHRYLCWLMAHPAKLHTRTRAVLSTWGQYCHHLVLVLPNPHNGRLRQVTVPTRNDEPSLELLYVPIPGQRDRRVYLWRKSRAVWQWLYEGYGTLFDIFVRADDDTYLNMPQLAALLEARQIGPSNATFLGRRYQVQYAGHNVSYYSGGSGTILTQATLGRLGRALQDHEARHGAEVAGDEVEEGELVDDDAARDPIHNFDTFADDMELGRVLEQLGIPVKQWSDAAGRRLFLGLGLDDERLMSRERDPHAWLWSYDQSAKHGRECCSPKWVGTHYLDWQAMYYMHDLILLGCEGHGDEVWWLEGS